MGGGKYKASVDRYKSKIKDETSALRYEISAYLSTLNQATAKSSAFANEVELLSDLSVDGIITTNWDVFIEQLFPEYRPFVGQKELLFSNPQQIAEIYKIHGCSSRPESLVLTAEDYEDFNARNPYLAAKLITLFVEHPIVFIGYSLSDENIQNILSAISSCIGSDNIEKLRKNLIFVQRPQAGQPEGVSHTSMTINGIQIPLVLVATNDFCPVYEAIGSVKRKIPVRVLRYCKEQLYELVKTVKPVEKMCVAALDEITKKDDIEFLVGIGVASREEGEVAEKGYMHIALPDLFSDLLRSDRAYDALQILNNVVPVVGRNTPNVPVFQYLRRVGIDSAEAYEKSGLALDKWVRRDLKDFRVHAYTKPFFRDYRHKSIQEIVAECTPEIAASYIPFLSKDKIDLDVLHQFLVLNEKKMNPSESVYASNFKKLAVLYDKLKWGW